MSASIGSPASALEHPAHGAPAPRPDRPLPATVLAASFDEAARITRQQARNFYYGLRLTPEPRRSAIYSIYAWMRAADDVADEPAHPDARLSPEADRDRRRAELARFAWRTDQAMREGPHVGPGGDPAPGGAAATSPAGGSFWPAFAHTLANYPIDPRWIRDMLAGLAEDLDHAGYATRDELARYCYRVGGTVGLTCVAIWGLRRGVDAAHAHELAVARGRAFQVTNILRDIGHDADDTPPRLYVPRDALTAHGLDAAALRAWARPEPCAALVRGLAAWARELFERSRPLDGLLDPACAPALWGMTRIYAGVLEVIERDPHRCVSGRRARLSPARKGMIALSAAVRARVGAWGQAGPAYVGRAGPGGL